ncbi:MAG: thiamine-phosphate kinase [Candidatus Bathyarchaeota archaeon]|nr:thiamine-phosphate kinase [Candidatus Bathyarchaeota archaeon]
MSRVSDVGERTLIQRIMKQLTPMPGMPIPFWDDASALSLGDGRALVVNTDMLVWKTDIPAGMTSFQAARKAVVMNVSDLGAKGAQPTAFMPNIGIPDDYPVEAVEDMAKGFEAGAREYGCHVVGGDTNEACDVIISGTALGIMDEKRIMLRAGGAKPGHILATTGYFGLTSVGFTHLMGGIEPQKDVKQPALDAVYMPKARVEEGIALSKTGVVSSCMDSSDGLSVSLYDLRRSIGFGFVVDDPPIHPLALKFAERKGLDPVSLAFNGGEEYELVFTYPPSKGSKIKAALKSVGCELLNIGVVSEGKEIVYRRQDKLVPIKKGGWNHFTGQK